MQGRNRNLIEKIKEIYCEHAINFLQGFQRKWILLTQMRASHVKSAHFKNNWKSNIIETERIELARYSNKAYFAGEFFFIFLSKISHYLTFILSNQKLSQFFVGFCNMIFSWIMYLNKFKFVLFACHNKKSYWCDKIIF